MPVASTSVCRGCRMGSIAAASGCVATGVIATIASGGLFPATGRSRGVPSLPCVRVCMCVCLGGGGKRERSSRERTYVDGKK
jgi:hypothetical protein